MLLSLYRKGYTPTNTVYFRNKNIRIHNTGHKVIYACSILNIQLKTVEQKQPFIKYVNYD